MSQKETTNLLRSKKAKTLYLKITQITISIAQCKEFFQVDKKSFFTREFLWWLSGQGSGISRGEPVVVVCKTPVTDEYHITVGVRFSDDIAAAEFALSIDIPYHVIESPQNWSDHLGDSIIKNPGWTYIA